MLHQLLKLLLKQTAPRLRRLLLDAPKPYTLARGRRLYTKMLPRQATLILEFWLAKKQYLLAPHSATYILPAG